MVQMQALCMGLYGLISSHLGCKCTYQVHRLRAPEAPPRGGAERKVRDRVHTVLCFVLVNVLRMKHVLVLMVS